MMDEQEDLAAYINELEWGSGQNVETLHKGYQAYKDKKYNQELAAIAQQNGLQTEDLKSFVDKVINRMIFDGEALTDLFAAPDLGWRARKTKEETLMTSLIPHLKKLAQGREISGLAAYE
ncbi:MAG: type I restriction endonuclease subunit R, EcoR124 family [Planktothrix sp.]